MELFQLLGTILISNTAANSAIDETTGRAENSESKMSKAFKKWERQLQGLLLLIRL